MKKILIFMVLPALLVTIIILKCIVEQNEEHDAIEQLEKITKEAEQLAKITQENFKKLGGGKKKTIGGIEFMFIPGGTFLMGQIDPDIGGKGISNSEQPVHKVTVSSFWIGIYEVTQKQYHGIMGTNPSEFKGANNPVEQVEWVEAKDFCQRFSQKYGVMGRLPYEAEWEYACRAGTTTRYYWGDGKDSRYCWFYSNSGRTTHPVGQKLPNNWGLYDMSGNVWEHCEDWFGENYYSMSPAKDPKGPMNPDNDRWSQMFGGYHVLRGGSWLNYGGDNGLFSAGRAPYLPLYNDHNNGFRLAIPGEN